MATLALLNIPILPIKPGQRHSTTTPISSPQPSAHEEYLSPRSILRSHQTSSDSDSSCADQSLTDDTDNDSGLSVLKKKRVHFNVPLTKIDVQLKLENDEAEFFAYCSTESIHTPIRKRDRIRSTFRRKFCHSNSNSSDSTCSSTEWNEVLAKTLTTMQQDVQAIITGLDQVDQSAIDNSQSNISTSVLTSPRLSFHERQQEQLRMTRMADMLSPPNLLTYDMKKSSYPYTDIVEPKDFQRLRRIKGVPDECLLVQHKPFQHKKFRYRTQRGLLKMQHDLRKIKRDVYGEKPAECQKEALALDIQKYRFRLEKTLLDVRKQMAEYDRVRSSTSNCRPSISQIIAKIDPLDRQTTEQIEDYRLKSSLTGCTIEKEKNELISSPYIPPRVRNHQKNLELENNTDRFIDKRFDPTTFLDLTKEAKKFFGSTLPYWDQPVGRRLSVALPLERDESTRLTLPNKAGVWNRLVLSFKTKQKLLHKSGIKQHRFSHGNSSAGLDENEEFFDCSLPSVQRRRSQSFDSSIDLS